MKIDFTFACTCGHEISETFPCPEPNFMAEKNRDSYTEYDDSVCCDECDKEYEVTIMNSFGGTDVYIDNGEIAVIFGSPYYDREDENDDWLWEDEPPEHHRILNQHLDSAISLLNLDINDADLFSLNVMTYGHVVAAIEGFLSSVFIKTTVTHEELIRKLVETDPQFSSMKFTMSQLFEKREQIKDTVAKYLHDLIFHDFKKIKPMYNDVLGHDFEDIEWLFIAVSKRHHCVHRAGYDKEGNPVKFAEGEIIELINKIKPLAESVVATVDQLNTELSQPF